MQVFFCFFDIKTYQGICTMVLPRATIIIIWDIKLLYNESKSHFEKSFFCQTLKKQIIITNFKWKCTQRWQRGVYTWYIHKINIGVHY